mmetsp:Transcript_35109/g.112846  ORF Transcript_35109/g.112846 Transcript_35109/m.112846 type:complete len:210 (-) Transcript_35109:52-681(-)
MSSSPSDGGDSGGDVLDAEGARPPNDTDDALCGRCPTSVLRSASAIGHGSRNLRSAASVRSAATCAATRCGGAAASMFAWMMLTYDMKEWPSETSGAASSDSATTARSPPEVAACSHACASECDEASSSAEAVRIASKASSARSIWPLPAHTPNIRWQSEIEGRIPSSAIISHARFARARRTSFGDPSGFHAPRGSLCFVPIATSKRNA